MKLAALDRQLAYPSGRPCYRLVEAFPITLPDGRVWAGRLYETVGPAHRRGGRRVQVADQDGGGLFDSDDCFDFANAQNALDSFLASVLALEPAGAA